MRGRFFLAGGSVIPADCGSTPRWVSADSMAMSRLSGFSGDSRSGGACATADPWVEHAVQEVDGEVGEHRRQGEEEDHALDHHQIARGDRFVEQAPDTGQGEELLDDDRAADQGADLEAD